MLSSSHSERNSVFISRQLLAASIVAFLALQPLTFKVAPVAADGDSISIAALGTPVTEDFNSLATSGTTNMTLPTGFAISESGSGVRDNEAYAADDGSSNIGDTYSYGASGNPERALGSLRSGSLIPILGACFTNNTGSTITSLTISYTGEQWRLGTAGRTDRLNFQISTNATSLTNGSYTNVDALDFSSQTRTTVGMKDGNAAGNNAAVTSTISNLNIASGATFFIRWVDADASGGDDGLAVDDFSLTANGGGGATPTPLPIHVIQGSGSTSPLVNQIVTTTGIVTGRRSNGFFIQTPDSEVDADPNTSQGIFVFTSSAPPANAAIGTRVNVAGTVAEFVPSQDPVSPPLTEISSPTISVVQDSDGNSSVNNPLPAPVSLTASDTSPVDALEQLERYEGMRVRVASLTVVAPTQAFDQSSSEERNAISTSNGVFYGVITGITRPFREPGVEIPEPVPSPDPCCEPRFDANPERLRVDSDALEGAHKLEVTTGAILTEVVGPLDYSFRAYTILPDPPSVTSTPAVTNIASARPVPEPTSCQLTIGSFNLERFFDTNDDPKLSNDNPDTSRVEGEVLLTTEAFNNRLNKASLAIRNVMLYPDMLGVQEVENLQTLQAIATKINNDAAAVGDPNPNYVAYLEEGNDIGGINVGFLVKTSRVLPISVTQMGKDATFTDPSDNSIDILNDRPPLVFQSSIQDADGNSLSFTVVVNHLRSLRGAEADTPEGRRIRAKRRAQAEFLANLLQNMQSSNPNENIISVGDYNSYQFNDGLVDVIGTIKGTPTPAGQAVLTSPDLINPDFLNLIDELPATERYSFVFDGNAQALDHILVNNKALARFSRYAYARNNADFPESFRNDPNRSERISDHDMPIAYFNLSAACAADVTTQRLHLCQCRLLLVT